MRHDNDDLTNINVRTCYAADPWGGYGMDWFDAMQCCYFQNSYLAEPTSQEEMDKIAMYLTICKQIVFLTVELRVTP